MDANMVIGALAALVVIGLIVRRIRSKGKRKATGSNGGNGGSTRHPSPVFRDQSRNQERK